MQKGIGRAGYRLLGLVFFATAMLGLAMGWTAAIVDGSALFLGVGIGMAGAGLTALLLLLFILSTDRALDTAPRRTGKKAPDGDAATADAPAPAAGATPPTGPTDRTGPPRPEHEFEFADYRPAAPAAPEQLVLPKAFEAREAAATPHGPGDASGPAQPVTFEPEEAAESPAREPGQWPDPRGGHPHASVGRPRAPAKPERQPPTPQRHEMTERYTRNTPLLRQVLKGDGDEGAAEPARGDGAAPQEVAAERAAAEFDPDWLPKDKTRGRCSQCSTVLLAPKKRPIRLKCPVCSRVTLLE